MKARLVPLFLMLVACGTPQEQCIARESRDLRTLDRLITETEGNIARGFAYRDETVYTPRWVACPQQPLAPPPAGTPAPPPRPPALCLEEVAETVTRPVAIDLNAERAKLASMRDKRTELARRTEAAIGACRATYPE